MDLFKFIISVVVAVIGWIAGHYFTSKRDSKNKRREVTISFLIETYQKLENAIQRNPQEVGHDLELVIANLQLFGSNDQAGLARKIATNIAHQGSADLEPVLLSLRNDLRKELLLPYLNDEIQFLRMEN